MFGTEKDMGMLLQEGDLVEVTMVDSYHVYVGYYVKFTLRNLVLRHTRHPDRRQGPYRIRLEGIQELTRFTLEPFTIETEQWISPRLLKT